MIKVGINGFGRIGRLAARLILREYKNKINLVCVNTSGRMETAGWTHLFEFDTAYGKYDSKVDIKDNKMVVDGVTIPILGEREPDKVPWGKYGTQIVIESTGVFRNEVDVRKHLRDTVKKVVLSAPPKEGNIPMYIIGVNQDKIDKQEVLSFASCTTNCVAPVTKVIDESFGIKKAFMSTIHAYTSDQRLLDGSHKDLRRARAAAVNIVPTTTGAAKATAKVYPAVEGIFDGIAIRVPILTASLTDFSFVTKKKTTVNQVNQAFKKVAAGKLKDILGVTSKPLVSSDMIGLKNSALVDLSLTNVVDGDLVKVFAWYDNELGYCYRLVEGTVIAGEKI